MFVIAAYISDETVFADTVGATLDLDTVFVLGIVVVAAALAPAVEVILVVEVLVVVLVVADVVGVAAPFAYAVAVV